MGLAQELREAVKQAYSDAADNPRRDNPFPIGRQFAESLGYPSELLSGMPAIASEAFTGVTNISVHAAVRENSILLDLGCGAGLDSLILAHRAGRGGKVVGVDYSRSMILRAVEAARISGTNNVLFCCGDAENLPIGDEAVDGALVNGIFNLNPARQEIFRELARVVRRGGEVHVAELVLVDALREIRTAELADWFA